MLQVKPYSVKGTPPEIRYNLYTKAPVYKVIRREKTVILRVTDVWFGEEKDLLFIFPGEYADEIVDALSDEDVMIVGSVDDLRTPFVVGKLIRTKSRILAITPAES